MIATLPRSSGRGGDLCCAIHRGRRVKIEFIVKTKVELSCVYRVRVAFRGKSIVAQLEPNPAMRLLILQMNAGSCALENNSLNRFQGFWSTVAKIGLAQPPNRMETDQSKMPSKTERYENEVRMLVAAMRESAWFPNPQSLQYVIIKTITNENVITLKKKNTRSFTSLSMWRRTSLLHYRLKNQQRMR